MQSNGPLKMSTSESLESMTMLGYMEGGIKAADTIKIANQLALR